MLPPSRPPESQLQRPLFPPFRRLREEQPRFPAPRGVVTLGLLPCSQLELPALLALGKRGRAERGPWLRELPVNWCWAKSSRGGEVLAVARCARGRALGQQGETVVGMEAVGHSWERLH